MAGMTLAIEPMVNAGTWEVAYEDDDWTVVTDDGSLSAHYENTILVTKDGCDNIKSVLISSLSGSHQLTNRIFI